jgi:hypothetical protein
MSKAPAKPPNATLNSSQEKPQTFVRPTVRVMRLADLKPAPYNPRTISKEAQDALTESLREFGILDDIVMNKRTGHIVAGHQRWKSLMDSGIIEAPVKVVDWDLAKEKAANLTLNNPHAQGQFTDGLQAIIDELKESMPLVTHSTGLDLLSQDGDDTPLSTRGITRPPAMTWVLCGIPTVKFGEVVDLVEGLKKATGAQVHISVSDQ